MKDPVLVIGAGSIGRRHIVNLRQHLKVRDVAVYDADPSRATDAERRLGARAVPSLEAALDLKPSAALVCTPPALHAASALELIERRIPVFVEKPAADRGAEARALARAADSRRVVAAVGYQLRRSKALRWIAERIARNSFGRLLYLRAEFGQYLPDWRPWQDYTKSYTARRELGGGILLDASHELDLVRWLGGEAASVSCFASRLSRLEIDVEDAAELTLRLKSGALASVHVDMVRRSYRRLAQFVFEERTLHWAYPDTLEIYEPTIQEPKRRDFEVEPNELYVSELRLFLKSAAAGRLDPGLVSLADAARTLELVEAARRSSAEGKTVALR